jgi:hypothetical protein
MFQTNIFEELVSQVSISRKNFWKIFSLRVEKWITNLNQGLLGLF